MVGDCFAVDVGEDHIAELWWEIEEGGRADVGIVHSILVNCGIVSLLLSVRQCHVSEDGHRS